jgi:hypothetical protein
MRNTVLFWGLSNLELLWVIMLIFVETYFTLFHEDSSLYSCWLHTLRLKKKLQVSSCFAKIVVVASLEEEN